jgi:hypothetical protein
MWRILNLAFIKEPPGKFTFQVAVLVITLVAGLVCFIPSIQSKKANGVFYGPHFLVGDGISSRYRLRDVAIVSFSIMIPSTVNALVDILQKIFQEYLEQNKSSSTSKTSNSATSTNNAENDDGSVGFGSFERLFYFVGIQSCSYFVFVLDEYGWGSSSASWAIQDNQEVIATIIITGSIAASFVVTAGSLIICFHREYVLNYPRHIRSSAAFTTVAVASIVVSGISFAMMSYSRSLSSTRILAAVSGAFSVLALLALVGNGLRWVHKSLSMFSKLGYNTKKKFEQFYTPLVLLFAYVLNSAFITVTSFELAGERPTTGELEENERSSSMEKRLFDHFVLLIVSALSMIVLHQRLKNIEMTRNLVSNG